MDEGKHLLGAVAQVSSAHMLSGRDSGYPHARIWGDLLAGASLGLLHLWGTCPERLREAVSVPNTCECGPDAMTVWERV